MSVDSFDIPDAEVVTARAASGTQEDAPRFEMNVQLFDRGEMSKGEKVALYGFAAATVGYLALLPVGAVFAPSVSDKGGENVTFGSRQTQAAVEKCTSAWCVFSHTDSGAFIALAFISSIFLSLLLLIFARKAPVTMTWGGVFLNCVIPLMLIAQIAIECMREEDANECISGELSGIGMMLAYSLSSAAFAYWTRAHISITAKCLQAAAAAIFANLRPLRLPAVLFQTLSLANVAIFVTVVTFWAQSPTISFFSCISFYWMFNWLRTARLNVTSMVVGYWAFGQNRPSEYKPVGPIALRTIFRGESAGAVSLGSIFVTLVDTVLALVGDSTSRCWNPVTSIVSIALFFIGTVAKTMTRYAVVGHAFTGASLYESAHLAKRTLSSHFLGSYVSDNVGQGVLLLWNRIFAFGFAILCMLWISHENNWPLSDWVDFLKPTEDDTAEDALVDILLLFAYFIWMMCIITLAFTLPTFTLLLLSSLMPMNDTMTKAALLPYCAIVTFCCCMLMLQTITDLLSDSVITLYMAYAVAMEHGKPDLLWACDHEQVDGGQGEREQNRTSIKTLFLALKENGQMREPQEEPSQHHLDSADADGLVCTDGRIHVSSRLEDNTLETGLLVSEH